MTQEEEYPPAQKTNILMARSRVQFPVKLYYSLLEMAHTQCIGCSGAVIWLTHGRAFKILDEDEFMEVDVPIFFKQTKIRSFYRQLNLWGYKRVYKGIDAGAWYNDHFLREQSEEMKNMVRIKIKGKAKLDPMDEKDPNFYSMPLLTCVNEQSAVLSHAAINRAQNRAHGLRRVFMEIVNGSNHSMNEFQLSGSNHSHMSHGSEGWFQQLNGSNHSINEFQLSGDPFLPTPQGLGLSMREPPLTRRVSSPMLDSSMEEPLQRLNVWTNSGVPSTKRNLVNHNNGFFHRRVSMHHNQQHQPSPMTVSSNIFSADIELTSRLMGEIKPVLFGQVPSSSFFPEKLPSSSVFHKKPMESRDANINKGSSSSATAGLEPLPFSDESEHGVLEDEVNAFPAILAMLSMFCELF